MLLRLFYRKILENRCQELSVADKNQRHPGDAAAVGGETMFWDRHADGGMTDFATYTKVILPFFSETIHRQYAPAP